MNRSTIRSVGVFVVTGFLLAAAPAVMAQGRGRGQAKHQNKAKVEKVEKKEGRTAIPRNAPTIFGSRDREIISSYYGRRSGLPPGLAKRGGDLPPGLEKQLRRNGRLPPGLEKKIRPFPAELERQLGPLPRGYRRGILDNHAVVYRTDNETLADILRDMVR
jgi:hypothetical protein